MLYISLQTLLYHHLTKFDVLFSFSLISTYSVLSLQFLFDLSYLDMLFSFQTFGHFLNIFSG